MPTVYIAAPFELQNIARTLRVVLEERGLIVTSRWLEEEPTPATPEMFNSRALLSNAERDLVDIENAQALIAINPEEYRRSGTGGRHVEFGIALATKKPIFIYGVRSNVFHSLPQVVECSPSIEVIVHAVSQHFRTLKYRN